MLLKASESEGFFECKDLRGYRFIKGIVGKGYGIIKSKGEKWH